jgi:hypothetical protein
LFPPAANAHLGVDVGGEARRQPEAFTRDGTEALERESDLVFSGPELRDDETAFTVGDGRALLLDQHRAGGGDSDARQHGA